MKLTAKEHPEAIKRYRHVKAARGLGRRCAARFPEGSHVCTLAKGHRGPHVARVFLRGVEAVWDTGTGTTDESVRRVKQARMESARRAERAGRRREKKRPVGLRERSSIGVLGILWHGLVRAFSSIEEFALLVMFLVFVYFGIDWLLLIFR